MSGPSDLYDLCNEFLAACAEAVATAPGGPVERLFVSPGVPAWDCCPQLSVHVGGPIVAETSPTAPALAPGHRDAQYGAVFLISMTATILRCAPEPVQGQTNVLTAPGSYSTAAAASLADLWSIWNHLRNMYRAGSLFATGFDRPRELYFDPAVALPIEGGVCGWQVPIRVQLDGYSE